MNTPETDARVWSDHSEGILHEVVEASFARRLEMERDEAREKAERYRLEANALMLQRDEAQNKLRLEKLTTISQKEEIEILRQLLIEARK